ncbi:MAG: ATP-binding protein [Christensenellales bacterium]
MPDCIAQRIMERAYLVRRVTAYRLCEIMRKNQFDGSEARAVEGVMDCDLLFIDDLGTEPQTKNTSGYLFQVINERQHERPTHHYQHKPEPGKDGGHVRAARRIPIDGRIPHDGNPLLRGGFTT